MERGISKSKASLQTHGEKNILFYTLQTFGSEKSRNKIKIFRKKVLTVCPEYGNIANKK